jgi:hypothetical protein
MFFTNASGDLQPYVSWKGHSTKAAIAGYSRPMTNKDYDAEPNPTPAGKPNPIKHWRKSLRPSDVNGISRAAYSIQSDIPGANVPLGTDGKCCDGEDGIQQVVQQYVAPSMSVENAVREGTFVEGPNGSRVCINCNPETNIIRSGMTEKMINPQEVDGKLVFKKYSFSTKEYLKSKCKSYDQNISGALRSGVQYSEVKGCCVVPLPYNNENVGPQTRDALDCPDETCHGNRTKVIVKPNNQQYFQQGAVSSSSRLARLKYNTVQSNAASFNSAYQAQSASAGRYRADGNAPYFIKSKDQSTCNPHTYFRKGNRTMC